MSLKLLNEKIPLPGMRLHRQEVEAVLQEMILNGAVVMSRDNIYLPRIFELEDETARQIAKRLVVASMTEHIAPLLERIKTEMGVSLSGKA